MSLIDILWNPTYSDAPQSVMSQSSYWAPTNDMQSPIGSVASQNRQYNQYNQHTQQYNQYNQQQQNYGYSISEEEINRRFELYKDSPLFKAIRDATRGGSDTRNLLKSQNAFHIFHPYNRVFFCLFICLFVY